jgi:hypothetical protein
MIGGGGGGAWDRHAGASGGAWELVDGREVMIWTWAERSATDLTDGEAVEVVWRIVAARN